MPFYEYECASCKFYSEVMQKITDAPLKKCPSCGKNTMKKLISAPVFRLKGGGWYETDFKWAKEPKRNLAGDSDGSDRKPAQAKSTDAKPADSKSEAKPAAAEKPAASDPARASRGARKPAAKPPARAPAAKAPARKSVAKPKPKAKAGKRRGR